MNTRLRDLRLWIPVLLLTVANCSAWAGPAERAAADPRRSLGIGLGILLFAVLAVLTKAAAIAFNLCAAHVTPALFRKGRDVLAASPVKSFFVGLVNIVLVSIVGFALANQNVTRLLGLLLLAALLLVLVVSRTLVYQLLGTRLVGEPIPPEGLPSCRAHCWGGVAIELGFLTPIVGQLAGAIVTVMTTGALVLAAMTRERAAPSSTS